jgi:hypothetical protein
MMNAGGVDVLRRLASAVGDQGAHWATVNDDLARAVEGRTFAAGGG